MRPQTESQEEKPEQTEEEDRNEEEVTVALKRPATSQGSLQKKKRLSKKEMGVNSRNEYLQWLQEYKEEKKSEEGKK